ncbi:hypothetical protein UPYG_G00043370 [Umbra pygmaea]|uniref:Uncharacterized protein n=1 Tax=Umbra pygmaea TaxID=75934 RepID=A0ABD0YEH5_UMBPY
MFCKRLTFRYAYRLQFYEKKNTKIIVWILSKTMWTLLILLGSALIVDGVQGSPQKERVTHGNQLKIILPTSAQTLEFTPAAEPLKTYLCWKRGSFSTQAKRGRVSGSGSDKNWYLDKVTYEDEGIYVQKNLWNYAMSSLKVSVTIARRYEKCVAGEELSISLAGLNKVDAHLSFSGAYANVTLVYDGAVVAQDISTYWDRVTVGSNNINIRNVNTSDVGSYTLKDRRDRIVSVVKMELVDKHENRGSPLMALLLLLGIPAGICCCCRKKICRNKDQQTTTTTTTVIHGGGANIPPPAPCGPTPGYDMPSGGVYPGPDGPEGYPQVHPPPNPGVPGQPQWTGPPPQPGFSPMYPPGQPQQWNGPPTQPVYPPAQPQQWNGPPPNPDPMYPPAQPQQWNGPPPNPTLDPMYPPNNPQQWNGPPPSQPQNSPGAPMGYAPVMYNALSSGGDIKMEKTSPTDPLLPTEQPQVPCAPIPPPGSNVLQSSEPAYQFNIDTGKNPTNNFL